MHMADSILFPGPKRLFEHTYFSPVASFGPSAHFGPWGPLWALGSLWALGPLWAPGPLCELGILSALGPTLDPVANFGPCGQLWALGPTVSPGAHFGPLGHFGPWGLQQTQNYVLKKKVRIKRYLRINYFFLTILHKSSSL